MQGLSSFMCVGMVRGRRRIFERFSDGILGSILKYKPPARACPGKFKYAVTPNPYSAWSDSLRLFPSRWISTSSHTQNTSSLSGCFSKKANTILAQILICRFFSNKELEHLNWVKRGRTAQL